MLICATVLPCVAVKRLYSVWEFAIPSRRESGLRGPRRSGLPGHMLHIGRRGPRCPSLLGPKMMNESECRLLPKTNNEKISTDVKIALSTATVRTVRTNVSPAYSKVL